MRNHEIKNSLVQYFVDGEIFNENGPSLIVDVQSVSSSKELELKFQIRQLEIQEREKEREWEERYFVIKEFSDMFCNVQAHFNRYEL